MAAAAILNFGKMSITRLDKDICSIFYGNMHRSHAEMTT